MGLFNNGMPLSYKPKYLKDFSHRKKCKLSYTTREAQILAPQYLKQVQDCTRLLNTTINPNVYFMRYDLMISCLVELKKMQKAIKFSGQKPSSCLNEALKTRDKQLEFFITRIFNNCRDKIINLKTHKAKENQVAKFTDTINSFANEIPSNLNITITNMVVQLRNMVK